MRVNIEITRKDYTLEEYCVTEWLKKLNDNVEKDEILCTVDLGKGVYDVTSPKKGKLIEILANTGEWYSFKEGLLAAQIGTLEV
jgi:pyruvate/2-oxoglutarate dehydrogenase complex dihydrolipoamide acyltransferase (E2) component